MSIPTLHTERLILRPFTLADAKNVQELAGDAAVADTTLNIPHPYNDGMAESWIATHEAQFADGYALTLAITFKSNGTLAGTVSLAGISPGHQAELGYWIGQAFWNQGFCTEASSALIHYAFHKLGLQRVHSCHISRNPASGRVMQKLGMRHEGTRQGHVWKHGAAEDLELYGILRGDVRR